MNILVISHYGLYQDLHTSFVHAQAAAYAALGHNVRALILVPVGKGGRIGSALGLRHRLEYHDNVELYELRYLSLSNYGDRNGFNISSALCAVRTQYRRILDGFQPDVIHAHTLGFDSEIGAWFKKKLECPLVVTTHGSDTSIPLEQGRAAELKKFCDAADHVVAVSSALAKKLQTCGTHTPISTILNGFRVGNIPAKKEKTPFSLVQVCHLIPQKKVDVTIRAFAAIQKQHPNATLTIVGQGGQRQVLEQLCEELGISHAVRFLGEIPNSDVLQEMSKAQFFVMPSVREGFGIVYLEAMACGCVVIGTEGEGIADLVESGKNGFLVPPDNAEAIAQVIERCDAEPESTLQIALRGQQDALGLTWEKNGEGYIELFRRF